MMNFLSLVFSLLLILSIGFYASFSQMMSYQTLKRTYVNRITATRKLFSHLETETYQSFLAIPKKSQPKEKSSSQKAPSQPQEDKKKNILINPQCAQLNLKPLIQEGKEMHPELYALTLHFLKCFYEKQLDDPELFLKSFLMRARETLQKGDLAFEKLQLPIQFQESYYHMLKGSKKWEAQNENSYPSFLEIFTVHTLPSKLCLYHAHLSLLKALFTQKAAERLYAEIHSSKKPTITRAYLEQICSESHLLIDTIRWLPFIEMGKKVHPKPKTSVIVIQDSETQVTLKKQVAQRL